ncbi:MAG: glycosyl transferase family [Candidatus Eremiobacteraeota bacterium]|nr:glycosyl transferase family [Candidatus Eremiobacteraeota bacterium]
MIDVAVVIPAYNAGTTLGETLASVRAQTAAPREVIVVDDGSHDDTAAVAEAAGVTVLRVQNGGVSAARNSGAARSQAAWIAYLDADDLWAPEMLASLWSATQANPDCSAAFCDHWQFDERGLLNDSVVHEVHRHFGTVRREPAGDRVWRCDRATLADALSRQGVIMPSTLMVRKSVVDAIGGWDESIRALGEDTEFELRLLARTDALFVDVPLMGYRRQFATRSANRSAVRAGDITVADRVGAAPSRYLPSSVQWYRHERPAIFFRAGRMAAAEADHATARRYLLRSLRERLDVRTIAWLALSYVVDNAAGRAAMAQATKAWFAYRARRLKATSR